MYSCRGAYLSGNKVTMENSKVKLTPQEVFNNKKLFSNKIHARVLKVTLEILKFLDKLKIVNEDKNLFLNSVNHYYKDLSAATFNLRQVAIRIDDDEKQSVCDLLEVITELNKIVLAVQESLNLESGKLLSQVKDSVIDVGLQVETIMKIIECDNLHEYKQQILDIQHDLVISVEAFKLYCQSTYLTISDLEGKLHEEIEKTKNKLIQIKTGHEHLAKDFSHYIGHSVQHIHNLYNYWQKQHNTDNFPKEVVNVIKIADGYAIAFIKDMLEAVHSDNPINKLFDVIENCHTNVTKGSAELQKALQVFSEINIGKKDDQALKTFFIHTYINLINAMSGLNQSIEDAIIIK